MNRHLAAYIQSFKVKEEFWYAYVIEAITVTLLTLLFVTFGRLLNSRAMAISGGKSVEELKAALIAGTVEANQAFLTNIKVFTFLLVLGTIVVVMVALLLWSLSQALVWAAVLKTSFSRKRYWRWNGLTLVVVLLIIPYFLSFALIKSLANLIIPSGYQQASFIIGNSISFIFLMAYLLFLCGFSSVFAQRYKVWESLGHTFRLFKARWNSVWKMFLLALGTGLLLSVILAYMQRWAAWNQFYLVQIAFFLLYFSWLRFYLVRVIHEPASHLSTHPPAAKV